ncbi:MAG TPA: holo-ACP synthase [Gemmatimonadaceae bacterium]|nr:holo-ACP synthase [Gemmatimonadaceae bacterium]
MIVGVGVDLVDIDRVARLIDTKGDRALRRLFSDVEIAYASRRASPAMHLAARLAAKEATYKALSGSPLARGIGWREIEVGNGEDGQPVLVLHGRARERADELAVARLLLTMTHSAAIACAVVIAERD